MCKMPKPRNDIDVKRPQKAVYLQELQLRQMRINQRTSANYGGSGKNKLVLLFSKIIKHSISKIGNLIASVVQLRVADRYSIRSVCTVSVSKQGYISNHLVNPKPFLDSWWHIFDYQVSCYVYLLLANVTCFGRWHWRGSKPLRMLSLCTWCLRKVALPTNICHQVEFTVCKWHHRKLTLLMIPHLVWKKPLYLRDLKKTSRLVQLP